MALKKEIEKKIKVFTKEFEVIKAEQLDKSKKLFKEVTADLFEAYPEMTSFGWKQYTINWNDGDECNFQVYTDSPDINGYDGYELPEKETDGTPVDLSKAQTAVEEFLCEFDEELMEDLFGDHKFITVYRDGSVDVECYEDHD